MVCFVPRNNFYLLRSFINFLCVSLFFKLGFHRFFSPYKCNKSNVITKIYDILMQANIEPNITSYINMTQALCNRTPICCRCHCRHRHHRYWMFYCVENVRGCGCAVLFHICAAASLCVCVSLVSTKTQNRWRMLRSETKTYQAHAYTLYCAVLWATHYNRAFIVRIACGSACGDKRNTQKTLKNKMKGNKKHRMEQKKKRKKNGEYEWKWQYLISWKVRYQLLLVFSYIFSVCFSCHPSIYFSVYINFFFIVIWLAAVK